jgi:hypothetical protein
MVKKEALYQYLFELHFRWLKKSEGIRNEWDIPASGLCDVNFLSENINTIKTQILY